MRADHKAPWGSGTMESGIEGDLLFRRSGAKLPITAAHKNRLPAFSLVVHRFGRINLIVLEYDCAGHFLQANANGLFAGVA